MEGFAMYSEYEFYYGYEPRAGTQHAQEQRRLQTELELHETMLEALERKAQGYLDALDALDDEIAQLHEEMWELRSKLEELGVA
jgi:SMC interacting uncharacterized protein involved in chromosome segregation